MKNIIRKVFEDVTGKNRVQFYNFVNKRVENLVKYYITLQVYYFLQLPSAMLKQVLKLYAKHKTNKFKKMLTSEKQLIGKALKIPANAVPQALILNEKIIAKELQKAKNPYVRQLLSRAKESIGKTVAKTPGVLLKAAKGTPGVAVTIGSAMGEVAYNIASSVANDTSKVVKEIVNKKNVSPSKVEVESPIILSETQKVEQVEPFYIFLEKHPELKEDLYSTAQLIERSERKKEMSANSDYMLALEEHINKLSDVEKVTIVQTGTSVVSSFVKNIIKGRIKSFIMGGLIVVQIGAFIYPLTTILERYFWPNIYEELRYKHFGKVLYYSVKMSVSMLLAYGVFAVVGPEGFALVYTTCGLLIQPAWEIIQMLTPPVQGATYDAATDDGTDPAKMHTKVYVKSLQEEIDELNTKHNNNNNVGGMVTIDLTNKNVIVVEEEESSSGEEEESSSGEEDETEEEKKKKEEEKKKKEEATNAWYETVSPEKRFPPFVREERLLEREKAYKFLGGVGNKLQPEDIEVGRAQAFTEAETMAIKQNIACDERSGFRVPKLSHIGPNTISPDQAFMLENSQYIKEEDGGTPENNKSREFARLYTLEDATVMSEVVPYTPETAQLLKTQFEPLSKEPSLVYKIRHAFYDPEKEVAFTDMSSRSDAPSYVEQDDAKMIADIDAVRKEKAALLQLSADVDAETAKIKAETEALQKAASFRRTTDLINSSIQGKLAIAVTGAASTVGHAVADVATSIVNSEVVQYSIEHPVEAAKNTAAGLAMVGLTVATGAALGHTVGSTTVGVGAALLRHATGTSSPIEKVIMNTVAPNLQKAGKRSFAKVGGEVAGTIFDKGMSLATGRPNQSSVKGMFKNSLKHVTSTIANAVVADTKHIVKPAVGTIELVQAMTLNGAKEALEDVTIRQHRLMSMHVRESVEAQINKNKPTQAQDVEGRGVGGSID